MKINRNTTGYLTLLLLILAVYACSSDVEIEEINISAPENIGASITVEQDNSGEATITPKGENANWFIIDFGDGSELSDTIQVGNAVKHVYEEGEYNVGITGLNIAHQEGQGSQALTISYKAPENLEVDITKDPGDPFTVNVSATADLSAGFEILFGEDPDQDPVFFNPGETVSYTFSDIGEFEIQVTALSGGANTTTYRETIKITDPFVLPINFESETVSYAFFNFGGGEGDGVPIVDNPDPDEVNDSEKVGQYTKVSGAETWGGTSATLNTAIDFTKGTVIEMEVYAPAAGIPVLLKVEDANDPDNAMEVLQNTTQSGAWETLSFDFTGIAKDQNYSVLSIFFNFDNPGEGNTYYFDNIRITNAHPVALPLNFEGPAESYSFLEFDGSPASVVSNPNPSGINTSAQVAQYFKVDGAGPYAGAFIDLDTKVDFSNSTKITLKILSPQENASVLLKFEDPNDGSVSMEVEGTVQEKEVWEEVTFDFSGIDPDGNWGRLIFFPDFGTPGAGTYYYIDDIMIDN